MRAPGETGQLGFRDMKVATEFEVVKLLEVPTRARTHRVCIRVYGLKMPVPENDANLPLDPAIFDCLLWTKLGKMVRKNGLPTVPEMLIALIFPMRGGFGQSSTEAI